MITELTLNRDKAKKVDAPRSISKSGMYTGVITQVEMLETDKGANMMNIAFLCDDGSLSFLSMCLTSADGQETFNMGLLHAMMTILNVESIKAMPGKVFNRVKEIHDGYRVPALEKKRIGLLLQRVNDFYKDKEVYQLNIVSVFDPVSQKTAHEIIDGKEATTIAKRLEGLSDRDSKRLQDHKSRVQQPNPLPDVDPTADFW